uniref:Alpha/beta hydrolase domain-containing protein 17C n=1 Tax=Equus caballus TaxID=9796 RepID=A0A9L0SAF5_HORSE
HGEHCRRRERPSRSQRIKLFCRSVWICPSPWDLDHLVPPRASALGSCAYSPDPTILRLHLPRYGVSPENIILYGQSIGTVPTVDLASRYECAAVILHSPLMSGLRVAFPDTRKTYCFDAFPSIDKISKVTSPVLVIHGTEDEVIDFSHGLAMYERCPRAVEPLWVEGAGHNDIELYAQYLERLKQFISHELPNS